MPTSDEDLDKQKDKVQKLREDVAQAEATRINREASLANDETMLRLQTEEAQLRARLAEVKESSKASSVKAGNDAPLSAAKADMEAAVARQKAAENPGDDGEQVPTSTTPEELVEADTKKKEGGS